MQAQAANITQKEKIIGINLCRGLTSKQIARAAHISPATVNFHVTNLKTKLNAANSAALAALLVANKFVKASDLKHKMFVLLVGLASLHDARPIDTSSPSDNNELARIVRTRQTKKEELTLV